MNPITHALVGWTVAEAGALGRRDRGLVLLAGVVPDIDGLGIVVDLATARRTELWSLHHQLAHNVGAAVGMTALAALLAQGRRARVAALAAVSFHLHLLGDLAGSKGPDGDAWPIPYLLPFSDAWQLTWSGQWALNAWPNFAITAALLALAFRLAWRRGYSPVGLVSPGADAAFVAALRDRFGPPPAAEPPGQSQ